jgi:DNA invertase Pin-like site-specific DNA recombinase
MLAIYLRVSTDKQDTDSQETAIVSWLATQPHKEIRYYRDVMSGTKDARPGFLQLQADIAAGTVKTVVLFRLDRLTRNASTALRVLLDWIQRGIEFYVVDQPILSAAKDDPFRLTKLAMFSELAQIERETIVSRVKAGLRAAKARGVRLGAKPTISEAQQQQGMAMLAEGRSYRAVAAVCCVSLNTVHRWSKRA